jgi:hypothetical protein
LINWQIDLDKSTSYQYEAQEDEHIRFMSFRFSWRFIDSNCKSMVWIRWVTFLPLIVWELAINAGG